MKTMLALVLSFVLSAAAVADNIVVRVTDAQGLPIQDVQVVAILKSGAYQDAVRDAADGDYKCQPTEQCIKVFAAARGFEAMSKKYPGDPGVFAVALKANQEKDSAVLRGRSKVESLDGELGPRMDAATKKLSMFSWKIALLENGKAKQPIPVSLNRAIDAQSGTGGKFKIWVVDITPQVAIVEFTRPK